MSRSDYFQNRKEPFKINARYYLKRINVKPDKPSLDYLRQLHRAHLLHIPFENLDIHYNKKIVLDYEKIFRKVILRKRGGYCYELNGLFFLLLRRLGFVCSIIAARVRNSETGKLGRAFDHMALVVSLDGDDYLVDVGFGNGIVYPKLIQDKLTQVDHVNYCRLVKDPDGNFTLQLSDDASHFSSKYVFSTEPREVIQFMEMNEFQQTSNESMFLKQKLVTRLTETGRVTLTTRTFTELKLGKTTTTQLNNEDEFISKLEQYFGITVKRLIR